MNSHKMYRIELKSNCGLAKEIAVLACLSNGGKYLPLTDLEMVAKGDMIKYPSLNEGLTIHLIGNSLLIDNGTVNCLCITEVEVLDLDVPTLSAYDAKKLMNEMDGGVNGSLDEGLLN